jgi:hypothetical protein
MKKTNIKAKKKTNKKAKSNVKKKPIMKRRLKRKTPSLGQIIVDSCLQKGGQ